MTMDDVTVLFAGIGIFVVALLAVLGLIGVIAAIQVAIHGDDK